MLSTSLTDEALRSLVTDRFTDLSTDVINDLITIGEIVEFDSSEVIIRQGEQSEDVYFLLSGRAAVYLEDESEGIRKINEISSGEIFGEMSTFTKSPRSTSIVSIRQTVLYRVVGHAFMQFLDSHPQFYKAISTTLIQRLASANTGTAKQKTCKNIALYSLHPDYPLSSLCKHVTAHLQSYGKVHIVKSADLLKYKDAAADLISYLNTAEIDNDYILFVCPADEEWVARAMITHSDQIMMVRHLYTGAAVTKPPISIPTDFPMHEIESYLLLDSIGTEAITGSAKCLEDFPNSRILHLHKSSDYGRIARFIAGQCTKLVLSGGGARGLAHLGVHKALLEVGIEIDAVGGTSIGSIMSALVACGWDYNLILEEAKKAFIEAKPLKDYQFPLVSLLKGKRLDKTLKARFKDLYIEDLPIPYLAVAANLSNMSTEIIDRGLVRDAARASIAIPSILPPAVREGKLLLDGGIVDNMPYDAVQSICQGPIIGVDLSTIKERQLGYQKVPTNLQLTKAKLKGSKTYKVPNIYQIIMGTMTLASDEKKRRNIPKFDLYIQPNVRKFGFLDFKKFDALIEEGYRSSLPKLEAWAKENGL